MISDFNSIAIVDYNSLLNVMILVALASRCLAGQFSVTNKPLIEKMIMP